MFKCAIILPGVHTTMSAPEVNAFFSAANELPSPPPYTAIELTSVKYASPSNPSAI